MSDKIPVQYDYINPCPVCESPIYYFQRQQVTNETARLCANCETRYRLNTQGTEIIEL